MGGFIQCCCLSEGGTICCSVLSILGMFYFLTIFLIFDAQKNFFEIHLPNPDDTKLSCLVSSGVYLVFFAIAVFRLWRMNLNKAKLSPKHSISDSKEFDKIRVKEDKIGSVRELMEEHD